MFDEHETRPWHFFIPMIMVIIGGVFVRIEGWSLVGWLIIAVAVANVYFLIDSARQKRKLEETKAIYEHDYEITRLEVSKTKTKVVIDKTALNGFMHHTYNELNIPPGKLKKFAHGVLVDNRPLTIREWTPLKKHKEFSDTQWRVLTHFMKQPDWEDRHIKFIVPVNPNNEHDGFELTAAGEKWLTNVLQDETVLTPT